MLDTILRFDIEPLGSSRHAWHSRDHVMELKPLPDNSTPGRGETLGPAAVTPPFCFSCALRLGFRLNVSTSIHAATPREITLPFRSMPQTAATIFTSVLIRIFFV